MSTKRFTLLLVEKCSHCFSFYDIESGQRIHSIPLPDFPHEFVVDAEQKFAYVGHYGVETSGHLGSGGTRVFQIDIENKKVHREIDLHPFNRLHGIQMDVKGRLYVLSEDRAQLLVLTQPRTDNAPQRAIATAGIKSHLFALTRDGKTAYAMNLLSHTVSKLRPHDPLFSPVVCHPGEKPEGYALSHDERTLYVTCRWSNTICAIDTQTMTVIKRTPSREDPTRLYLYRENQLIATNYGQRSLSVYDPESLSEINHIPMEARAIALSFHPAEPIAFVSQDNNRVGIFNMNSHRFERWIETQLEPDVSVVVMQ